MTKTERATALSTKASAAVGVLAAVGLAVVVNLGVSRSFKRWDWTTGKLYSLSEPTKVTLRSLGEPVEIDVLLSASDRSLPSLRNMLEQYRAETDKLIINYYDPDREPQRFKAFQQKHDIAAGRAEDGRVVTDAQVVIVRGEKRWFLTSVDLVDPLEDDPGRVRPRLEQGLTTGIRAVLSGERTRVCFAKGHGELPADEPGRGVSELRYRLLRNNVEVTTIELGRASTPERPWAGCDLAYVAGPERPWPEKDAAALQRYLEEGGSVMMFVGPILDPELKRPVPTGLEELAKAGGIELRNDLVVEQTKARRLPDFDATFFFAEPKRHEITSALVEGKSEDVRLLVAGSRSLGRHPASTVPAAELLVSSKDSFSITRFPVKELPTEKGDDGQAGPLAIAMASELPKPKGSQAAHGPRLVVFGTTSFTTSVNWQNTALLAGAYLGLSAISWATARPPIVEIPSKPAPAAGVQLTEESYKSVRNYVVLYIPLALGLVGASVFLRRASTERRKDARGRTKTGGS